MRILFCNARYERVIDMISNAEKELHGNHGAMVNNYKSKVKSNLSEIGWYIAGSLVFFACISMMIWPVQISYAIGSWRF